MVKLEGVQELKKAIQKALLSHKVGEVRKSLKRGADLIVNAAKANVTINDGGRLKNSIKILPQWRGDPTSLQIAPKVVIRRTKRTKQKTIDASPYYAHWWEYGTDPHDLSYKGKFVSGSGGGQHPGTSPHPYMRPAYDVNKQAALNAMMDDITKMIEAKV